MPDAEAILAGLTRTANAWSPLAVVWHLYFALMLTSLHPRLRRSRRVTAALLGLPLVSVALLAWIEGNPFNGTVFAASALVLLALAPRLAPGPAVAASPGWALVGALLFTFGWVYPHFLATDEPLVYLYAAPTGLVPCPTLAIVTGFALMTRGLDAVAWPAVLAGMGLFYGLFGALRLGVQLDWGLTAGALVLLVTAVRNRRPAARITE